MLALDPDAALLIEAGIMLDHVTIDGAPVRAGLTLGAFERLIADAGYDEAADTIMLDEMLERLRPTIEAHIEVLHFMQGGGHAPLIIEIGDLVTH